MAEYQTEKETTKTMFFLRHTFLGLKTDLGIDMTPTEPWGIDFGLSMGK